MLIKKETDADVYTVSFKYDTELVNFMRNTPGRKWHSDRKVWTIPADRIGFLLGQLRGTEYESQVRIFSDEHINQFQQIDDTEIPDVDISDIDLVVKDGYSLYQHQLDFLKYMKARAGKGCILADDQGLGKTLEVTNYAMYQRKVSGYKHCLILCCVNTAKFSWLEDIESHTNGLEHPYILGSRIGRRHTMQYHGTKEKLEDLTSRRMFGNKGAADLPYFIIMNIEALRYRVGKTYTLCDALLSLMNAGYINMIAVDEVHRNVSPSSTQGKLLLKLKSKCTSAVEWIPMTGTPIVNKPTDVYTPLKLVDGHTFKTFSEWKQAFVIGRGFSSTGAIAYKNIDILKSMLQKFMIRRIKSKVLDLPDKIFYTEYVVNTQYQMRLYGVEVDSLINRRNEILSSGNPLVQMLRLRQINGSPELVDDDLEINLQYLKKNAKMSRCLELIEEIINRNEKVVVFSNWIAPLKTLYRFIASKYKVACFTGTMGDIKRQENKHMFLTDPNCHVMVGTIGALGANHTLAIANNVIFFDDPWNNASKNQAMDRCHRIGSTKNVNIYTLISKGTIDEHVQRILSDKKLMSGYIVDGDLDIRNNPSLFDALLKY